jgi:hypothetical protein
MEEQRLIAAFDEQKGREFSFYVPVRNLRCIKFEKEN